MQRTFKKASVFMTTLALMASFSVFSKPATADDETAGKEACAAVAGTSESNVALANRARNVYYYKYENDRRRYCEYDLSSEEATLSKY